MVARVLVVDDSQTDVLVLNKILSDVYEVDFCLNGKDAINKIKNTDYDLFILDINLDDMDGYGICDFIRTERGEADKPIIFITSSKSFKDEEKAFEYGAVDFITKPFYPTVVKSRISTHLDLYLKKKELELKNWELSRHLNLVDKYVLVSYTDLNGIITHVSDAFCELTGYSKLELIGKSHRLLRHSEVPKNLYTEMWQTITADKVWKGELKNVKKDGSVFWVKSVISPVFDLNKRKIGYCAIREDVTDKKRIEELSIKDCLTGLYNRRYFNEQIIKLLNSSKRNKSYFSFMMMDVDYFKNYNDYYGHVLGDEVLVKISNYLRSSLKRGGDYAFRIGGEEFAFVLDSVNINHVPLFAEKLRMGIEELNIEHKASPFGKVTVSMGLVILHPNCSIDVDTLIKEADKLLYKSKDFGRNKLMFKIYESSGKCKFIYI